MVRQQVIAHGVAPERDVSEGCLCGLHVTHGGTGRCLRLIEGTTGSATQPVTAQYGSNIHCRLQRKHLRSSCPSSTGGRRELRGMGCHGVLVKDADRVGAELLRNRAEVVTLWYEP